MVKDILYSIYKNLKKYYKYKLYCKNYANILHNIRNKKVVRVVFFVIDVSMWKNTDLFRLMLNDSSFDPIIVSYLYPDDPIEYRRKIQQEMKLYFDSLNFPFLECYDFINNRWLDIQSLNPDIIFYAQPYNVGYVGYKLENFWNKCLFAYIPYCLPMENESVLYSGLYQNICWKSYCSTIYNRIYESRLLFNKGMNMIVSGHPLFDNLDKIEPNYSIWKISDKKIKRIIWAPHHTILDSDVLHYSTFMGIAEKMLKIAKQYQGKIQFAFKPHPRLKPKLYAHKDWGQTKTDWYYDQWNLMPNTILSEGEYDTLFVSSDAMIHDSSSFTCEYLYTGKPVMFLSKYPKKHLRVLNDLGKACFKLHYIGNSMDDIVNFIENVKSANDPMFDKRKSFISNVLKQNNGVTSAEFIYNDMKKSLL